MDDEGDICTKDLTKICKNCIHGKRLATDIPCFQCVYNGVRTDFFKRKLKEGEVETTEVKGTAMTLHPNKTDDMVLMTMTKDNDITVHKRHYKIMEKEGTWEFVRRRKNG